MKLFFSLCLVALLSCAVAAQGKIAIINSTQFTAEKGGITKLVNAYTQIDAGFKTTTADLTAINQKISALATEVNDIGTKLRGNPPNAKELQAQYDQKTEEGQNLQLTFKRKQEDAKAEYEKREQTLTGPIIKEISDAIDAYAKAHGYDLVLDGAKLDSLMAFNPAIDITDAFIKDFNAKSSGIPIKP